MKVAAFLPVKGTSERIPNKNTQLLDGKPLFLHTLEKLTKCDFIDDVYLDTESENIFERASHIKGFKLMKRNPKLASNKTDGHMLFMNEVKHAKADIYVQILCTSPFISPETIRKGINILSTSKKYDSVILVKKDKLYLWKDDKPSYDINHIPNSIDLPDTTIETMGLYISTRASATSTNRRFGDKAFLMEATPIESIDVNFPEDFELAQFVAAGIREKERQLLKNMSLFLSSAMLSDIMESMHQKSVITGFNCNLSDSKIFGRAKTLKLRALRKNEPTSGIYTALQSYKTLVPNDVIVVENEVPNYAYFGELNANLAIRSGACGAIIGGKTRDCSEVQKLKFPVFSTGNTCKDVKGHATLDSINHSIHISGIEILPNDLIFADNDGMIVVPRANETEVLDKAICIIKNEKNIRLNIALGAEPEDLINKFGTF